jgi:beta-glucosidase
VFLAPLLLMIGSLPTLAAPVHSFPTGFKWCVATAAHQIEGGNTESDWWDWEHLPGKIKRGEISGPACDHWNRLEEDVALIRKLGVKQYRFSIEWAKIEPVQGRWDMEAVNHYRHEIALLEASGIEPMITLHHFTLPRWVRAQGGWSWNGSVDAFARYARFAYSKVAPGTRDWITINEPMVHLLGGYAVGLTPPGVHDMNAVVAPYKGLLRAHAAAYRALHSESEKLQRPIRVGIAHHLRVFDPDEKHNFLQKFTVAKMDAAFNWSFGQACETGRLQVSVPGMINVDELIPEVAQTQDFIGVNYYSRDMISFSLTPPFGVQVLVNDHGPRNDLGWEIYPEGFYRVLKSAAAHFPGKPILITENGTADAADAFRPKFLTDHLAQLHRAISEGVPVEGYCHWSLMDNFEWIEGFAPRFGLYAVDYATQKRTARPSAKAFAKIVRENGF